MLFVIRQQEETSNLESEKNVHHLFNVCVGNSRAQAWCCSRDHLCACVRLVLDFQAFFTSSQSSFEILCYLRKIKQLWFCLGKMIYDL